MTEPSTIVIFGASGDLTKRKLVPALFRLDQQGHLDPATTIVGVSRTPMTDEAFAEDLYQFACSVLGRCDPAAWGRFAPRVRYVAGDAASDDDRRRLDLHLAEIETRRGGPANRLYYLSVAPRLYEPVLRGLGEAGMLDEERGWRRLVIEKPFGHDLDSARQLNAVVADVAGESQVFRIDHYLGKETVQNLLVFRFANTLFEPVWNRNYVDHVQITVAESVDVGDRAGYYDGAGVLRDMIQNHLLQLLAITAMEPPSRFEADALRDEKVKVLQAIQPFDGEAAERALVRGQYAGYHELEGVEADSRTPTFAALRLDVNSWRWRGVPFYLRSGKALAAKRTEIIIQFLCPPHMIFDLPPGETLQCNRLAIRIQPGEGIRLHFLTKVPDQGMRLQPNDLAFSYRESFAETPIPEAYERLLLDALAGDAALFMRRDEIEASWAVVEPLLDLPAPDGLLTYQPGTWGPDEAGAFMARDGREWVVGPG